MKIFAFILCALPLFYPEKESPDLNVAQWYNTDTADGKVDLRELKGKAVLIDFWGIWCGGCVENIPKLRTLREDISCDELEIITIHTPINANGLPRFIRERNFCFTVGVDKKDPNDRHAYYGLTTKAFEITQFPSYVLISKDGQLVEKFEEKIPTLDQLRRALAK